MGRSEAAALTAASTVVGAAVAVLATREMIRRQAQQARRRIGKPFGERAPDADRVWRRSQEGEPVELLLAGDSIAAGLGAERRKDTLGARLAKGIARERGRPVRLRTVAVVGAESSALGEQLDAMPEGYRPDVAVVVIGGNDVTHRVPVSTSVAHLEAAVRRLRDAGAPVLVATCPDLGALRAVPQPLRSLVSRLSRQLAAAQAKAASAAGAHVVSLGRTVSPVFLSRPDEMFSLDQFHPSGLGYRRTAEALLPTVLAALGGDPPRNADALATTERAAAAPGDAAGDHDGSASRGRRHALGLTRGRSATRLAAWPR